MEKSEKSKRRPQTPKNSKVSTEEKKVKSEESEEEPSEEPKQFDDPTGVIKPNNYHKEEEKFVGTGKTFIAIQTIQGRVLEGGLTNQDKSEIIDEVFRLFEDLPSCVRAAIEQCELDEELLNQKCMDHHKDHSSVKKCHVYKNSKVSVIQCGNNETMFNDACYRDCPSGFEDYKTFCKKGKTIERMAIGYDEKYNPDFFEPYGENSLVKTCESYGQHYETLTDKLCVSVCPEGWKDYGILCEKPKRFFK